MGKAKLLGLDNQISEHTGANGGAIQQETKTIVATTEQIRGVIAKL